MHQGRETGSFPLSWFTGRDGCMTVSDVTRMDSYIVYEDAILAILYTCAPISTSQTTFSSFIFGWEEKESGNLTLEFPCYKIPRIWGLLIGDDEAKRSVNPLCVM